MSAHRVTAPRPPRIAVLFLLAYTCSGLAGLVYEVTWTRLLTLHLGHTTAAGSTVVGAFLLGLALGAALMGPRARRLTPAVAIRTYATLELAVGALALALPGVLDALRPMLQWAYRDGAPGLVFGAVRVGVALVLVLTPAVALGATFPLAVRWFASDSPARTRLSARLYAANTLGAAAGALLAGFVLIPALGVWRTTLAGVAAGVTSAALALVAARGVRAGVAPEAAAASTPGGRRPRGTRRPPATTDDGVGGTPPGHGRLWLAAGEPAASGRLWLAAGVLGLTGFAALLHELAWTRVLALAIGPTTYAFAAALAAVIAGSAAGAWIGTSLVGRVRTPAAALALALSAAAVAAALTYAVAGRQVPLYVATALASDGGGTSWIARGGWITAALVVPTSLCLGLAFPLAFALAGAGRDDASHRFGLVYAVNTAGSVAGALAAGFLVIPAFGLQVTLQAACACLLVGAAAVAIAGGLSERARTVVGTAAVGALTVVVTAPPWDRALMASGAYLYAPFVPADLPLEPMLKAGVLRYYADGAAATVSVKTLTGTTTLTVDGKTDASNRGDMLTQALVAHLPLLVHAAPRRVAVVGLGSGVTVGAALTHPVDAVDVIEISPEVVEASRFFEAENHRALADPRTRLIVGDGRSHLRLARSAYDVIVSEPSNPWIAGVAALFTREYFAEARARLAPGGVFCQWANAYNISDADLRAIAATFRAVFPGAVAFLVGEHDVLLVGAVSAEATADGSAPVALARIAAAWTREKAVADLARYGVRTPFALLSLAVAGPEELTAYADGHAPFDDDRMSLEFSAPREIHRPGGASNGATLRAVGAGGLSLAVVADAIAGARAADWRDRGEMFARTDAFARAYDDFARALALAPDDAAALDGLVRVARLLSRGSDALAVVETLPDGGGPSAERLVARAALAAATGAADRALTDARAAIARQPSSPLGLEQLATLHADGGDAVALATVTDQLATRFPDHPGTRYFQALHAFLQGDPARAWSLASEVIAADPSYAAAYDLAGAALTRLDRPDEARGMFERSLTFDAHDSSAYANLGLLALATGDAAEAQRRFAEALWLDARSTAAREGLARALALVR